MASVPTSRLIGPVLAGTAALLGAAVMLLPQRFFMPRDTIPAAPPPAAPLKPKYVPPQKETRWPELAAKLEALREPWKGPDPATSPDTAQPQQPVEQQLAWEYVGYVEGAGLRTAIVVINGAQRFVSVGEHVVDPSFPSAKLVVKSVDAEKIEVEHESGHSGGRPQGDNQKPRVSTVTRKQAEPLALTPSATTPASISPGGPGQPGVPGVSTVPGLNTGGGRGLMPGNGTPPLNSKPKDPRHSAPGAPFQNPATGNGGDKR